MLQRSFFDRYGSSFALHEVFAPVATRPALHTSWHIPLKYLLIMCAVSAKRYSPVQ